jgi:hypothetical protein
MLMRALEDEAARRGGGNRFGHTCQMLMMLTHTLLETLFHLSKSMFCHTGIETYTHRHIR